MSLSTLTEQPPKIDFTVGILYHYILTAPPGYFWEDDKNAYHYALTPDELVSLTIEKSNKILRFISRTHFSPELENIIIFETFKTLLKTADQVEATRTAIQYTYHFPAVADKVWPEDKEIYRDSLEPKEWGTLSIKNQGQLLEFMSYRNPADHFEMIEEQLLGFLI